jgi:chromosome segregation ATPase
MANSEDKHLTDAEQYRHSIASLQVGIRGALMSSLFFSADCSHVSYQEEVGNLQETLGRKQADYNEINSKHALLTGTYSTSETTNSRLNMTIEEQRRRIADLEQQLRQSAEVGAENARLVIELRGRDGTLAENEEQLEEMEEHVENLSSAMVASEAQVNLFSFQKASTYGETRLAFVRRLFRISISSFKPHLNQARSLQEQLDEMTVAREEAEENLGETDAAAAEAESILAETRIELSALLRKYEASQDEVGGRTLPQAPHATVQMRLALFTIVVFIWKSMFFVRWRSATKSYKTFKLLMSVLIRPMKRCARS